MLIVPIAAKPAQTVACRLANQNVSLTIRQRSTGLIVDVYLDDALVIGGVVAHDRNKIVRDTYLGFIGDLYFLDTQGSDDPSYSGGLGTRFLLCYLEITD